MQWWRVPIRTTAGFAGALALVAAASGGTVPAVAARASSAWEVVPAPAIAGEADLIGVTALAPRDAWAVGYVISTGTIPIRTLTLHWDGIRWAQVPSPNPSPERNWLTAVSGSSRSDVWAAGSYWTPSRKRRTLLMHWNGHRWTMVPSPSVRYESLLNGVTALSRKNAWAVGSGLTTRFSGRTLIEHWDGASWTAVPSPSPRRSGEGSNLLSVAAASPADVWAVGDIDTGGGVMGTLTEHWDGRSWRAVPSPSVPAGALASSVTAGKSGSTWAVGWRQVRGWLQPLAMRWTGTRWVAVRTPSFPAETAVFAAVAVARPHSKVWAVGERGTRSLAAYWNGTSWTITPSANPGRVYNSLIGLAVEPGTRCLWAVGSYLGTGPPRALIERRC